MYSSVGSNPVHPVYPKDDYKVVARTVIYLILAFLWQDLNLAHPLIL